VRPERAQRPHAQPDDLPADLAQQLILAAVGRLAAPDVLVAVAADRVELDRDRELGDDDVGPDLEPLEEGPTHAHRVGREIDLESRLDRGAHGRLGRARRARRDRAAITDCP